MEGFIYISEEEEEEEKTQFDSISGEISPLRCTANGVPIVKPFAIEQFLHHLPDKCFCEDGTEFVPNVPRVGELVEKAEAAENSTVVIPDMVQDTIDNFMNALETACPGW